MRYFYSFLLYLAFPYLFLRLWWKSRHFPDYRHRLKERLGYYPIKLEKCLWVHAVSVGETIAAVPLIKALQARYPHLPFLVTTMTPTGAARVKAALGDSVTQVYVPYDFPHAVTRFLTTMQPVIGIIMETELWPNLIDACYKKQIPVCLVNARLSARSAQRYRYVAPFTRGMLQQLAMIATQGQLDAERFIALGAMRERVIVTGNIKFDLELPKDLMGHSAVLRESLGNNRFVWLAASTHEGEEEIILAAHKKLREKNPQALLVLVPRHPNRFDAVTKLGEQQGFLIVRRSQQGNCTPDTAIYLGDTMGELLLMYAASDVAFVAGSLTQTGGHNMLEPGALGKPIITGHHLFNFAEISELFISANALIKISDAVSLASQLETLMKQPTLRLQMGKRAQEVIAANRGALMKQFEVVCGLVEKR